MARNEFICPHCHSDNIQRFELIYHGSVTNSSSSTVGIGYGGGGLGIGTASTDTKSITNLGKLVAPPEKRSYLWSIVGGLIGVCILQGILQFIFGRVFGGLMSWVAFAGMIYLIYQEVYCWNRDVYPQLMDQWYHSYLCMKCGNRFIL